MQLAFPEEEEAFVALSGVEHWPPTDACTEQRVCVGHAGRVTYSMPFTSTQERRDPCTP